MGTCRVSLLPLPGMGGSADNLAPSRGASAAQAGAFRTSFPPLQGFEGGCGRAPQPRGVCSSHSGARSALAERSGRPSAHRPALARLLSRAPGHFSAQRPAAVTLPGTEGGGAASFLSGRGAQSRWLGRAAGRAGSALAAPSVAPVAHTRPQGRTAAAGVRDPPLQRPPPSLSDVCPSVRPPPGQTDPPPVKVRAVLRPQSHAVQAVPFSLDTGRSRLEGGADT